MMYHGRFAPSPTGYLHQGSLAALVASYCDARAHQGLWSVRIEDIDPPREVPGASQHILETIGLLGLSSDRPVLFQHTRSEAYQAVLDQLVQSHRAYGCACSRTQSREAARQRGLPDHVYPGTCRSGCPHPRLIRFQVSDRTLSFSDRWCGLFTQDLSRDVGDFVIKRADGLWAYQLAVLTDDHEAGITHVVRGQDLLDNTPRQIDILEALGWSIPTYMHIPLVLNDRHEKLSKQQGARPLDRDHLLEELEHIWLHLGFPRIGADSVHAFWEPAVALWRARWVDGDTI